MARILIVDDDDLFREMLDEMLKREGHQVVAVDNGAHALTTLSQQKVDLVITDILMPVKDGIELIQDLQKLPAPPPVIAVSGGRRSISLQFNLESAQLMGVRATLAKPFTRDDLRRVISDVLGA